MTRKVTLVCDDPFTLANLIIALISKLRKHLLLRYPQVKIIFGGINRMDIDRYNKEVNEPSSQFVIDDCVTQVNSYLFLKKNFLFRELRRDLRSSRTPGMQ